MYLLPEIKSITLEMLEGQRASVHIMRRRETTIPPFFATDRIVYGRIYGEERNNENVMTLKRWCIEAEDGRLYEFGIDQVQQIFMTHVSEQGVLVDRMVVSLMLIAPRVINAVATARTGI